MVAIAIGAVFIGCDSADDDEGPFYVAFQQEGEINETGSQLACGGTPEYSLGHPTYTATFQEIASVASYTGRILKKDGTYAAEMTLTSISDEGNGNLKYSTGVGSISIFFTCNLSDAVVEQQLRFNFLDMTGHQGVEITAVY